MKNSATIGSASKVFGIVALLMGALIVILPEPASAACVTEGPLIDTGDDVPNAMIYWEMCGERAVFICDVALLSCAAAAGFHAGECRTFSIPFVGSATVCLSAAAAVATGLATGVVPDPVPTHGSAVIAKTMAGMKTRDPTFWEFDNAVCHPPFLSRAGCSAISFDFGLGACPFAEASATGSTGGVVVVHAQIETDKDTGDPDETCSVETSSQEMLFQNLPPGAQASLRAALVKDTREFFDNLYAGLPDVEGFEEMALSMENATFSELDVRLPFAPVSVTPEEEETPDG